MKQITKLEDLKDGVFLISEGTSIGVRGYISIGLININRKDSLTRTPYEETFMCYQPTIYQANGDNAFIYKAKNQHTKGEIIFLLSNAVNNAGKRYYNNTFYNTDIKNKHTQLYLNLFMKK